MCLQRPFIANFLEELEKMYELCFFTLADRPYAEAIAKHVDPNNRFIKSRIAAIKTDQKGLFPSPLPLLCVCFFFIFHSFIHFPIIVFPCLFRLQVPLLKTFDSYFHVKRVFLWF